MPWVSGTKIIMWEDIKTTVEQLNPFFAREINKIKNVNKFKLLQARYSFGEEIIHKGNFRLNIEGKNLSFSDQKIPQKIRSILDYNWKSIPLGMVTHNSTESFIDHPSHVIPFRLLLPGKVFSILSIFDPPGFSNLAPGLRSTTAGCRSLIFLPKITHAESHTRLKKKYFFSIKSYPEKTDEHWRFFKELADAEADIKNNWYSEVVFFGKEFLSHIAATKDFRYYLLSSIWAQDSFRRNEGLYDFIISGLLRKLPKSLSADTELLYHLKQLIMIAIREAPGFVPAIDDRPGPIKAWGNIMLNCYRLRHHYPVFMQPAHYTGCEPVYYSIQHPTYFYEIPARKTSSMFTIARMKKLKKLVTLLKEFVLTGRFEYIIDDTLLYQVLKFTNFEFFHPKDSSLNSDSLENMVKSDRRFGKLIKKYWREKELDFPCHSLFFNGLIRISPNSKNNRIWRDIMKYY